MNVGWLSFLVAALAVWRVTHLLVREDGPWNVLSRLRSFVGKLLDCFYCFSLWVAVPAALWFRPATLGDFAILWLGLSGSACLLERTAPEPVVIEHLPESHKQGPGDP